MGHIIQDVFTLTLSIFYMKDERSEHKFYTYELYPL